MSFFKFMQVLYILKLYIYFLIHPKLNVIYVSKSRSKHDFTNRYKGHLLWSKSTLIRIRIYSSIFRSWSGYPLFHAPLGDGTTPILDDMFVVIAHCYFCVCNIHDTTQPMPLCGLTFVEDYVYNYLCKTDLLQLLT